METLAFEMFTECVKTAVPVAVVFELGNILVNTILRAAFGGRLWFGR